jgi:hypothetical protein
MVHSCTLLVKWSRIVKSPHAPMSWRHSWYANAKAKRKEHRRGSVRIVAHVSKLKIIEQYRASQALVGLWSIPMSDRQDSSIVGTRQGTSIDLSIYPRGAVQTFLYPQAAHRNTEHSFLIPWNARQHIRTRSPLTSNSSDEDIRYFAIIRGRLTSNDVLPPLKMCGIA